MNASFVCIGSAHWDVIARTRRPLHPGADVPGRIRQQPGGVALNIALALATIGRSAILLAAVGRDAPGDALLADATARGVCCGHVTRHAGPTDLYVAIEGPGGEVFAAIADCEGLEHESAGVLAPLRERAITSAGGGWIIADGNLPEPVLAELATSARYATMNLAFVPASPAKAGRLRSVLSGTRATLYLNRGEAEALCSRSFADGTAAACAVVEAGIAEAIVTDGAEPVSHACAAGVFTHTPLQVCAHSLTGAGDVFLAAHLAARVDGRDPASALDAALAATARHITREAI